MLHRFLKWRALFNPKTVAFKLGYNVLRGKRAVAEQSAGREGEKPGNGHGGARRGAGRPRKLVEAHVVELSPEHEKAQKLLLRAEPNLVQAMIASALNGDGATQRYLLDRLWGRLLDKAGLKDEWARDSKDIGPLDPEDGELLKRWLAEAGADGYTAALQRGLGLEALALQRLRAHRGCQASQKQLLEQYVGQPALPISITSESMSQEEAIAALEADLVASGKTPEEARALVQQMLGEMGEQG